MNKNKPPKSKPFPWKCPSCRARAIYRRTVAHALDVNHDGKVHHIAIKKLNTPFCTKCHYVFPDSQAHQQITLEFLRQAKLLTPQEIRRNRAALKLTQKRLAAILGIAEATMSRWETGGQIQQRSLDNLLRIFFACPDVRKQMKNNQLLKLGFVADRDQFAAVSSI